MSEVERKDNTEELKSLGKSTEYSYEDPDKSILETFPNQFPEREYTVEYVFNEFTSLCPRTGQPDFAKITLRYIPNQHCIETKSLKLYFLSFRQHGAFMETIVNRILEDCYSIAKPHKMEVIGEFNPRGGTFIKVRAVQNYI